MFGLALTGCSSMTVSQFVNGHPSMAPDNWMVGAVDGYGAVIDRFNNLQSQFHVCEIGTWNPSARAVTLVEHITYLQESRDKPKNRTWHFVESSHGDWTGTAADVIGTADGEQAGNAWHLVFHQKLPIGGRQVVVKIDDWRFREANSVALDHSIITKLGIRLATVEIAFVKSKNNTCQAE
nr:DUF3833 family protein [Acidocella sp.]